MISIELFLLSSLIVGILECLHIPVNQWFSIGSEHVSIVLVKLFAMIWGHSECFCFSFRDGLFIWSGQDINTILNNSCIFKQKLTYSVFDRAHPCKRLMSSSNSKQWLLVSLHGYSFSLGFLGCNSFALRKAAFLSATVFDLWCYIWGVSVYYIYYFSFLILKIAHEVLEFEDLILNS